MPAMTMCTRGRVLLRSPLPSLVTMTVEPDSAMRKFAPVTPTSARRKSRRSTSRARATSSAFPRPGAPRPSGAWCFANRSRICSRVLWIAGATMWLGVSSASWMMYSPRSVSTTSTSASSSASLSATSSPTMDLPLVTVRASACRQMSMMRARASAASAAQCTCPPESVTCDSNRSR